MAHTAYANLLSSKYYKQYIIILYMQLYTLIFCSIISDTYSYIIKEVGVKRKVEEGREANRREGKEGGREAGRGIVWSGGGSECIREGREGEK